MPTYDYECDACGKTLEMFQRMSEDPITKCPSCGKEKLRRLFGTGAAIVFKGSGFYQTDYRSESYKSAAAKESKESSSTPDKKASGDGSSNAPTKPDASPTPKSDKPSKPAE